MSAVAKLFMHLVGAESGEIAGESVMKNFVGQIELDDWAWSLEPESDPEDSTSKVPVPSVITISKLMDRASTPMMSALRSGDLLTVVITLAEAAETQFGLVIKLKKARLIDYSMEAKSDEKLVTVEEKWKLDYRELSFDHRENQQSKGSKYTVFRPAWASTETPTKGNDEKQIRTSLTSIESMKPGSLNELWDRIKQEIKDGKFAKK